KGRARQLEAGRRVERHVLVSGTLGDEHDDPRQAEERLCGADELDVAGVRRVEGAAVEPGGHESSITSSPTSISSPFRAPAARSTASSSSPAGGLPVTLKPRSVR